MKARQRVETYWAVWALDDWCFCGEETWGPHEEGFTSRRAAKAALDAEQLKYPSMKLALVKTRHERVT